jgi:beta-galactosidase
MLRRIIISFFICIGFVTTSNAQNTFAIDSGRFLMNGQPYRIFSGEMHYSRIPNQYWKDRLLKIKATGLNTVCTYAFWNFHEVKPGVWDFSGDKNIAQFIRTAQEVGLNVILRPGPYVCAEWDFGGMPAWLLKDPDLQVRSNTALFLKATEKYIDQLAKEVRPLLVTNGGPIIMVQLENEYGAYGNDKEYLGELRDIFLKAGFNVPLYAADNPPKRILDNAYLPGVTPVVNFGATTFEKARANFKELNYYGNIPQMSGEFWTGWFTPWGQQKLAVTDWQKQKENIQFMLDSGKSFNLYMIHGGTNFGFTAGAMDGDKGFEPDITSYDYDAPINEMGQPTQKCLELRSMLQKYSNTPLPEYPSPLPIIEIPEIRFESEASLWNNLPAPKRSYRPVTMESLDQYAGYILYRTNLKGLRSGLLKVKDLHDYATVFINQKYIGSLDRIKKVDSLNISGIKDGDVLDILVEALGHTNYSKLMNTDRKGITKFVTLASDTLFNWQIYNLPMDDKYLAGLKFKKDDKVSQEGKFFKGTFYLDNVGDTYLETLHYKKGFVIINGKNLGRFLWPSPQPRLFCPATYLKKGKNEIIIFDMLQTAPVNIKSAKSLQVFSKS